MNSFKYILTSLFLISIGGISFSQDFVWSRQVEVLNLDLVGSIGYTSTDVEKDANGNIYMAGFFAGTQKFGDTTLTSSGIVGIPTDDGFIAKYSAEGDFKWVETVPSPIYMVMLDIEVDISGNIYLMAFFNDSINVAGTTIHSENDDGLVIAKLNPDRELEWIQPIIQVNTFNGIQGYHLELTETSVFMTGMFGGEVTISGTTLTNPYQFGDPTFLASFDSEDGSLNWANITGIAGWGGNGEMAVDANGNVYLATTTTGEYQIGNETIDAEDSAVILMIKYDNDGDIVWIKRSESGDFFTNSVNEIDINPSTGDIFLTGIWGDSLSFGGIDMVAPPAGISGKMWIAKFNDSGDIQWMKSSNTPDNYVAITSGINVDAMSDGGVLISGEYGNGQMSLGEGSNEVYFGFDGLGFIAKYSANGTLEWAQKLMCSTVGCWLNVRSMVAVGDNQAVFTGLFQDVFELGNVTLNAVYPSTVSQPNIYLVKIDGDLVSDAKNVLAEEFQINISPNPANKFIVVENNFTSSSMAHVEIIDQTGKLIQRSQLSGEKEHVDISNLNAGAYFIRITNQEHSAIKKFIKIN